MGLLSGMRKNVLGAQRFVAIQNIDFAKQMPQSIASRLGYCKQCSDKTK
jgi:hypothetical protein